MIKFTVNSAEFRKISEKVLSVINQKLSFPIVIEIADGIIKMQGTNGIHYLEVTGNNVWNTENGRLSINYDNLETIIKLSGEITIAGKENKIIKVTAGRKNIILPAADIDLFCMPSLGEETDMFQFTESWLYETLSEMSALASKDKTRKIFNVINLSISYSQAEIADSARVSIRKFPQYSVIGKGKDCTLDIMCIPVLKKVLDKKSNSKAVVSMDSKYIKIKCRTAEYIIRQPDVTYIDTGRLVTDTKEWYFRTNREKLYTIIQYYFIAAMRNMVKANFVFTKYNDKLYSVLSSEKCLVIDEIETQELSFPDDFFISFNSVFTAQALKITDTEYPVIRGTNKNTYPLYIDGKDYRFFILPIKLENAETEIIKQQIKEAVGK